jgi:type VI secretion system protein ImpA
VLGQLADHDSIVRDLRGMHLVRPGRHGKLSVRDVLIAQGKFSAPAGEAVPSQVEIEGMLRAAAAEDPSQINAAREALRMTNELFKLLSDKVGIERVPDLQPLRDVLKTVVQVCDAALPRTEESEAQEAAAAPGEAAAPLQKAPGELHTREDALRMLDRVCEFLERTEPSNPAPLLIRRAQRLMNMSFVEILEDLAPDGLSQVRNVTGIGKQ